MRTAISVVALLATLQWQPAAAQTAPTQADVRLVPFRDASDARWGYTRPDGHVVIPPRYLGAGLFRDAQAPVKDDDGIAMIDRTGRVVHRIVTGTVSASALPIPPPAAACTWSAAAVMPSTGLECYVRQLRGSEAAIGGRITIMPGPGEASHAALILKLPNGVVVVEEAGYEGLTRRVLLPAVGEEQALQWRLKLYPDMPATDGCSEAWSVGVVRGGAFIEQRAGC